MLKIFGSSPKEADRIAHIAAAGGIGLWEWDAGAGQFWFSNYARDLLHLGAATPSLIQVQQRIYAEDQAQFLNAFTLAQRDQPFEISVRLQVRPEYFYWIRWRGAWQQEAGDEPRLQGTLQNIHDERLTRLELEFTQEMLSESQKIARIGSWQYDIPTAHLFWSEETFHIYGRDISLGPPQGEAQNRYFDPQDLKTLNEKAEHAMRVGHPYQMDMRAFRDDGHTIMVRMIGRPLFDNSGNSYLIVGTVQDITDWADLQRAQVRAEENQRTQNQFLASVSHEIRTPMNAIFGMSQLLLMGSLTPQQIEQTRVILSAARDLLSIINDLLDLAKVEAGHMTLEVIEFDLLETLREVTILHGGKIHGKGLEFTVDLAPDLPRRMEGDPLRLKQIIGNLLSNAAKFTKQGYINLKVTLEGQAGPQSILRFAVMDTGIGIPAHRLASVFEKYVQAETSTAREYGGTGLGLAICQELVQLLGGEIHVTSNEHKGTRFWFDIPLHPLLAETEPPLSARMMVLEPSALAAENLRTQLDMIGTRAVFISNPSNLLSALASAAAQGSFTHVMISDSDQYDANEVAESLRAATNIGEPPKLILLASPVKQTISSAAFNAITLKPALPHELRRILSENPEALILV